MKSNKINTWWEKAMPVVLLGLIFVLPAFTITNVIK